MLTTARASTDGNTRVGLDWAAIRAQLIAAGVPVLRLLPGATPPASTGRAVSAMWCAQRVWMSRTEPKAMHPALEEWMREQERQKPGCLALFLENAGARFIEHAGAMS